MSAWTGSCRVISRHITTTGKARSHGMHCHRSHLPGLCSPSGGYRRPPFQSAAQSLLSTVRRSRSVQRHTTFTCVFIGRHFECWSLHGVSVTEICCDLYEPYTTKSNMHCEIHFQSLRSNRWQCPCHYVALPCNS